LKVAVVGAGALGSVYGVRLALHGGVDVTFVVRPARALSREPIVIERVRGARRDTLVSPTLSAIVPPDADAVVVTIGTEDLDALEGLVGESSAPVVLLTPMLPREYERVRAAFGARALAAMPAVVAYARRDDGVVRYWLPPAPTKIDEPRRGASGEAVRELAAALSRAGLRGRFELGVHETNPATTMCFIPVAMLLAVSGSAEALAGDEQLVALASRACREGTRLGHRVGRPEPWAALAPALAATWALPLWLRLLGRASPEALFYAEEHFGRKLAAQHRLMIRDMIDLAREGGLPHDALDELARRLGA
jgi:2-dehydropantoate 2-reductase